MRIIAGIKIVANGAKGDKGKLVSFCQGQVGVGGQESAGTMLGLWRNALRKEVRVILQQPCLLFDRWPG